MHIGIDARTITGRKTGDRTYALGLIEGLAALRSDHGFTLYLDQEPPAGLPFPTGPRWQVRVLRAPHPRLWTPLALPRAARADGVDVLHVQYIAPACRRPAVVTTVHDVTFRLYPQWFALKDRLLLDWGLRRSFRTVAAVLTGSVSTQRDLARVYGLPAQDVVVAPYGISPPEHPSEGQIAATRATYGIEGPYALFVGVAQPRKNLPRIVRAFAAARREHGLAHRLVIVGKTGWRAGETLAAIAAGEAHGAVQRLGYVPDADLPALYAGADLFVFPTLYEGFGLPLLEAFAAGTPVITSTVSALPEVAGDAAELVDPTSEPAIAAAIGRVLTDPVRRDTLIRRGRQRVSEFTWEHTARLTVACYERVGEGRGR